MGARVTTYGRDTGLFRETIVRVNYRRPYGFQHLGLCMSNNRKRLENDEFSDLVNTFATCICLQRVGQHIESGTDVTDNHLYTEPEHGKNDTAYHAEIAKPEAK
jgi:hypothetical protein